MFDKHLLELLALLLFQALRKNPSKYDIRKHELFENLKEPQQLAFYIFNYTLTLYCIKSQKIEWNCL